MDTEKTFMSEHDGAQTLRLILAKIAYLILGVRSSSLMGKIYLTLSKWKPL